MEKTIRIMMVALCAHLLYSNSELLIAAQKMSADGCNVFDTVVLSVFALAYSLISTICVYHVEKYLPVMIFAILDGFAVYLRINVNQEYFLLIVSLFFGFYTFCLISFVFLILRQHRNKKQNEIENENAQQKNISVAQKNISDSQKNILGTSTKAIENKKDFSEDEISLYNNARAKINGSGKKPEKISQVLSEIENENVKQKIIETYQYQQTTLF